MSIKEILDTVFEDGHSIRDNSVVKTLFENNQTLIINALSNNDSTQSFQAILITSLYAHTLAIEKDYRTAVVYINKVIPLLEKIDPDEELLDARDYWNEQLRFDRGIANYHRKNFISSMADFNWLIKTHPQEKLYTIWRLSMIEWTLFFVSILLAICMFLSVSSIYSVLSMGLHFLLMVIIGISFMLEIKRKRLKKEMSG